MNSVTEVASEVKFRERMRGYDQSEVDHYVKIANHRAAQAEERIRELELRLAQTEAQSDKDNGDAEIRETLLRTLVMAQRTADSAISEAQSEAQSIIDSAQEQASQTVAEAEAKAIELRCSAEEHAAAVLAESESRVVEIDARLNTERDTLRSLAVSFQSFVEEFEQAASLNEARGQSMGFQDSGTAADEVEPESSDPSSVFESADVFGPDIASEDIAAKGIATSSDSVTGSETDFPLAGPPTMPFELDIAGLFDTDTEAAENGQIQEETTASEADFDEEFIEQLRQVVAGDAPQPDSDAAITAFFDPDDKDRATNSPAARNGRLSSRG